MCKMASNGTTTIDARRTAPPEDYERESVALVPVSRAQPIVPRDFRETQEIAAVLADSTFLEARLKGRAADVTAQIMTGAELGLPPMASLRGIFINSKSGRPGMFGSIKLAACWRSGLLESFDEIERNDQIATYEIKRRGQARPIRRSFTLEEARQAKLVEKDTYQGYAAAMLQWRCIGSILDVLFPDVLAGIPDETTPDVVAPSPPTFTAPQLAAAAAVGTAVATSGAAVEEGERKRKAKAEKSAAPPAPATTPPPEASPEPAAVPTAPPAAPPPASSAAPTPSAEASSSPTSNETSSAASPPAPGPGPGPSGSTPPPAASEPVAEPSVPPMMAGFREALRLVRQDHKRGATAKELGATLNRIKGEYIPWSKSEEAKAGNWHIPMREEFARCWADVGAAE